jgi:uncharacterized protein
MARDACVELLTQTPYVRIGFVVDGDPMVLPVNHLLHGGAVYFRTAAGSKLGSAAAGNIVVVEADEGDEDRRVGWSVVAKGRASIVTDEREIEALHAQPFEPWALPDTTSFWIRIDVQDIDGRRVVRA